MIGSRSWDCLWNSAWFGPHGFMMGNNNDEDKVQANKLASCHCYFKWFFEKPAHIESTEEKSHRTQRDEQKVRPSRAACDCHPPARPRAPRGASQLEADVRPKLDNVIPGKNAFIHLFFGIMFGWMVALIYVILEGGAVPWVNWALGNLPQNWEKGVWW